MKLYCLENTSTSHKRWFEVGIYPSLSICFLTKGVLWGGSQRVLIIFGWSCLGWSRVNILFISIYFNTLSRCYNVFVGHVN